MPLDQTGTKPSEERELCVVCANPSDDWMVAAKLITPDKSICGACKVYWGNQLIDLMVLKLSKKP